MFYSIRPSRLAVTSIAVALVSLSLAEVRQNPQDLSKRAHFAKIEHIAKMGLAIGAQQAAQQSAK
jgi:hypothetical protein